MENNKERHIKIFETARILCDLAVLIYFAVMMAGFITEYHHNYFYSFFYGSPRRLLTAVYAADALLCTAIIIKPKLLVFQNVSSVLLFILLFISGPYARLSLWISLLPFASYSVLISAVLFKNKI